MNPGLSCHEDEPVLLVADLFAKANLFAVVNLSAVADRKVIEVVLRKVFLQETVQEKHPSDDLRLKPNIGLNLSQ
jgi:hypothetical protein